jgi:hypothetical protein
MMKKILVIIILILGIAERSEAWQPDPWTTQDTILQLSFTTVATIDWLQTKSFTREGAEETNPILGRYPSQHRINILTGAGILIHAGVSYVLPIKYRTIWQSFFLGVECMAISHNYLVGVRINYF